MDDISVIPDYSEIVRGGFESRYAADGLVGICCSVRVSVFRHAEHTLYAAVFYKLFDKIHIGTALDKRDVYHLNTEIFADAEVSVITGNGAKELYLPLLHPGFVACAVGHALRDKIKHDIETRVAHDYDILIRDFKHLGENCLALGDTVENSVVSALKSG